MEFTKKGYIKVNDIIDNLYLESTQEDSFIAGVKRYHIQRFARRSAAEIISKHSANIKALRLDIKDHIAMLPDDFLKLWRISKIMDDGRLKMLYIDNNIPVANAYLLDDEGVILLGDFGEQLVGDGTNDIDYSSTGNAYYEFNLESKHSLSYQYSTHFRDDGNINPEFKNVFGYRIDQEKGIIQFQGDLDGTDSVIIEYSYDIRKNDENDDLEINVLFADALEKLVYYDLVSRKRTVPLNEKIRAKKEYREALLNGKLAKNTPSVQEFKRIINMK